MILRSDTEKRFVTSVGLLSLLCVVLFLIRVIASGSLRYLFVPENLLLAWSSLVFAWLLSHRLSKTQWKQPFNLLLTLLWLIFLPNSWYVLTDLIHLYPAGEFYRLYDIALVGTLVLCGFFLGFTSLYVVHRELIKRLSAPKPALIVGGVLLLSSFAIYLGRILRWNTWDVLTNPAGLILNISDRLLNPFGYLNSFTITALFFVLLSVIYFAFWNFVQPIKETRR